MPRLYDVLAVNIETGASRVIASGKRETDADAIVAMAVMRHGVDAEFFKTIPHCDTSGHEWNA